MRRARNLGMLTLFMCSAIVLGAPKFALAQCDQTLSVGAGIAAAVSSAPDDSIICLNSGNYGTVSFTNIARSGFVTLRSASGVGAQMRPRVSNVDFVQFVSMTLDDALVSNCSTNIQFLNNRFTVSRGLGLNNYGSTCTNYPANYLVDGNVFGAVGPSFSEGRLDIRDVDGGQGNMGITVTNNVFDGQGRCVSDGIQLTGNPAGITIGPNNIFQDIRQDSSSVHCDSIQIVGGGPNTIINGNWFRNGSVVLQFHDGSAPGVRFTNNVISNMDQMWVYNSVTSGFVFDHNTVYNLSDVFQVGRLSSGVNGRSNIILSSSQLVTTSCSGCNYSHNLFGTASQVVGTNQIVGTPTFVGGSPASISTFAGWRLASGSLGRNNGHDGLDRGTLYYGVEAPPPPVPDAPTNLRVIP